MLQFHDIVFPSGEIAQRFDRDGIVHIEIFWHYESFVADEIVHGFDESELCLEIALEDIDLNVVVIDVLFEEFVEFRDDPGFLHQQGFVGLEDIYGRGLGTHSLEYHHGDYERDKKNKIMKYESGYLFVGAYDFCLRIVHASTDRSIKYV